MILIRFKLYQWPHYLNLFSNIDRSRYSLLDLDAQIEESYYDEYGNVVIILVFVLE